MASSSSSAVWTFDVFLSFRGEDTRKSFVSHLYRELETMGIKTFKDDEELQRGKSISPELLRAIGESKFAVVVISQNYASSSWCLDELVEIIKCEEKGSLTILPVFYEVDPSDVKKQSGPFAEAFQRHRDNPKANPDKVQRWKEALTRVATIAGEDSRNWKEDSKLIEKIVDEISEQLVSTTSSDFSDLVGMEDHMEALSALLNLESTKEVRMIGIWGMAGVGKTALSRYVYEAISQHFQTHCFVEDVKKFYRDHGPTRLQEELLSKNLRGGSLTIRSFQVGFNVIKARLGHQKVLVVIDDVDTIQQLNVLAKDTNWFGPGSRIIITTQDKHLLVARGVEHVYKVECLTMNRALQLFSLSAFHQKQPLIGFEQLSVRAMHFAGGLPLALKVLGSFLCGRSQKEWESTFCRLERSLDRGVMDILKVSYDGLDEWEKSIFLHVACLFEGEHVELVSRLLGDHHERAKIGIQVLAEKSLIVISGCGSIRMHGLLQKMGRELVRRQFVDGHAKCKLLTDPEEISSVLMCNEVNKEIRGISLNMSQIKELSISDRAFERMSNLKFVKFYNHWANAEAKVQVPSSISFVGCKLKYLSWDAYPLRTLHFQADCLVVLSMQRSKLEKLWEGSPSLGSLKLIDLSGSRNLREFPDLSKAPALEDLKFNYCSSLIEVPSSIRGLNKLANFKMDGCSGLVRLPSNINLKSLQDLSLVRCKSLKTFPEISRNIRRLCVTWTTEIGLPDSIGHLSHLVELRIDRCKRLKTLPITLGNLVSLEILNLEDCEMLENFPNTMDKLVSLREFRFSEGRSITEFPCLPASIRELFFRGTSIEEVPSWINNLSKLHRIDLSENRRLKNLPASISKLERLESLDLDGCSSLENLPAELCETVSPLNRLSLPNTGIKELPDNFGNLSRLENFCVGKIIRGKGVLSIFNLTNLMRLSVGQEFYKPDGEPFLCPPLSGLPLLHELELRNLNMPEIPEDLGHYFPCLHTLDLSGNDFQVVPTSIKHLPKLWVLHLNYCKTLRSLPEISSTVEYLYAHGCISLESASQVLKHSVRSVVLSDCFQLGPEAQLLAQHLASKAGERGEELEACLPLTRVPKCFKHQAKGPHRKIHLPRSHSVSEISGLVTCIVVTAEGHYDINEFIVECNYDFRDNFGDSVYRVSRLHHVGKMYCGRLDVESENLLLFIEGDFDAEEVFQDISVSFDLLTIRKGPIPCWKVKECGVRLLFEGDTDYDWDGTNCTDETSDEEPESSSDKKQECSLSSWLSLSCGENSGGLRVPGETENIPNTKRLCESGDNERQGTDEPDPKRGKFLAFL